MRMGKMQGDESVGMWVQSWEGRDEDAGMRIQEWEYRVKCRDENAKRMEISKRNDAEKDATQIRLESAF